MCVSVGDHVHSLRKFQVGQHQPFRSASRLKSRRDGSKSGLQKACQDVQTVADWKRTKKETKLLAAGDGRAAGEPAGGGGGGGEQQLPRGDRALLQPHVQHAAAAETGRHGGDSGHGGGIVGCAMLDMGLQPPTSNVALHTARTSDCWARCDDAAASAGHTAVPLAFYSVMVSCSQVGGI